MPDEIKQDIEKTVSQLRAVEGDAEAAGKRALDAVNRQGSWVERHPKATLGIGVVLLLAVIALAVKVF